MGPITQPPSAPALWEVNYLTTILPPELSLSLLIPGDAQDEQCSLYVCSLYVCSLYSVMLKMNSAHYMCAHRMRLLGCRQPLTVAVRNMQHESEVIAVHYTPY